MFCCPTGIFDHPPLVHVVCTFQYTNVYWNVALCGLERVLLKGTHRCMHVHVYVHITYICIISFECMYVHIIYIVYTIYVHIDACMSHVYMLLHIVYMYVCICWDVASCGLECVLLHHKDRRSPPTCASCVYRYMYTYIYIYACMHTYIYMYVYMCKCICICIHIHTYIYIYIYTCIHMYIDIHMYISVYTHKYIYIYTWTSTLPSTWRIPPHRSLLQKSNLNFFACWTELFCQKNSGFPPSFGTSSCEVCVCMCVWLCVCVCVCVCVLYEMCVWERVCV